MSDTNLTVKIHVDETAVVATEAKWKNRIRQLNNDIRAFEFLAKKSVRRTMSAVSMTASAIQSIFSALPVAIDPVFRAILTAITTTITSLHAIAAAYAAGGVTAWLAGVVEVAAIGLSIVGIANAFAGQQQTQQELQRMSGVLRSIGSAMNSWTSAISSWSG
jgi:hypothetical protein